MILDNANLIARHDQSGAILQMMGYGEQAIKVVEGIVDAAPPDPPFGNVILVGFGTSGHAADAISAYACEFASVPIAVVKDKILPAYTNSSTLVVICSYSGDTSDCVDAYRDAERRGATIISITSGGSLATVTDGNETVKLPESYSPQFCLPAMFFSIYRVLVDNGVLVRDVAGEQECFALFKRQKHSFSPDTPESNNAAKQMASALLGKLPVVYAGSIWLTCVAKRWCAQLNASCKLQAHWNTYPELTHNELLAWRNAGKQSQQWAVILLRDRASDDASAARVGAAADAIPLDIDVHDVYIEGETIMARLWSGLAFADICSAYLAIAWGEDPSVG